MLAQELSLKWKRTGDKASETVFFLLNLPWDSSEVRKHQC